MLRIVPIEKIEDKMEPGFYLLGDFMHGDADASSKGSLYFRNTLHEEKLLIEVLEEFKVKWDRHYNIRWESIADCFKDDTWTEEYEAMGYPHAYLGEFFPRDVTAGYDGRKAVLTGYELLIVDGNGRKFRAEVEDVSRE